MPAIAADVILEPETTVTSADGTVTLTGGVGVIGIEGREYVFDGSGSEDVLSLLIWQSLAPMLTTGLDVSLPDGWSIAAKAQVALGGDSYMEDYDWLLPFRPSFASDDWTHRSQSENTDLDWYFNGSIALGKDIVVNEDMTVNVNGGFKYTDVQWAAVGGTFVYSVGGFRDTSGTFADVPAITYRQQWPALFLGADAEIVRDQWTFDFGAQAGVTFNGIGDDTHWMRVPPLNFVDSLGMSPTVSLSASAEYEVDEQLSLFVAGTFDIFFIDRGYTDIYNNDTGALVGSELDAAGAELVSASVSVGLKGTF